MIFLIYKSDYVIALLRTLSVSNCPSFTPVWLTTFSEVCPQLIHLSTLSHSLGCDQPWWTALNAIDVSKISLTLPHTLSLTPASTLASKSLFQWSPKLAYVPTAFYTSFLINSNILYTITVQERGASLPLLKFLSHGRNTSSVTLLLFPQRRSDRPGEFKKGNAVSFSREKRTLLPTESMCFTSQWY